MNRYWTHAAMLLLGISLTVGFYEGRRLVRNTSRALTAMSQIGTASERRERAEQEEAVVAEAPARRERPARVAGQEPKRRGRKAAKKSPGNLDATRLQGLKSRQRLQRVDPSRMPRMGARPGGGPLGLPAAPKPLEDLPTIEELPLDLDLEGEAEELVDTGL